MLLIMRPRRPRSDLLLRHGLLLVMSPSSGTRWLHHYRLHRLHRLCCSRCCPAASVHFDRLMTVVVIIAG